MEENGTSQGLSFLLWRVSLESAIQLSFFLFMATVIHGTTNCDEYKSSKVFLPFLCTFPFPAIKQTLSLDKMKLIIKTLVENV